MKKLFLLFAFIALSLASHAQSAGPTNLTGSQCLTVNAFISTELVITVTGSWSGILQPQLLTQVPIKATVTPLGIAASQPNIQANGIFTTQLSAPNQFQVCAQNISGTATVTFAPPTPTSVNGSISGTQCLALDVYIPGLVSVVVSGSWSGAIQPTVYLGPVLNGTVNPIGVSSPQSTMIANGTYTTYVSTPNVLQMCGASIMGSAAISMASAVSSTAGSISGMTAGQLPVAATATTIASSIAYTNPAYFPFQSLTTIGSSGAATLNAGVLNIPQYSFVVPTTLLVQNLNNIIFPDQLTPSSGVCGVTGSDASAKIQCAINILAAKSVPGGVVDARNLTDPGGTGSTVIDPGSSPIQLWLGPTTYNVTGIVLESYFQIIGMGGLTGSTILQSKSVSNGPVFTIPQANNAAAVRIVLKGFAVSAASGNTTQDAFTINCSGYTNSGLWFSTFDDIYVSGFLGRGIHLIGRPNDFLSVNQWESFQNVYVVRAAGGLEALRIEGTNGQLEFINSVFSGNAIGDGTNIYIGQSSTSNTAFPYSIKFDLLTSENANLGVNISGASGIQFTHSHHEKLYGGYQINYLAGGNQTNGVLIDGSYFNTDVGVNSGNGYLLNITTAHAVGIGFTNNQFTSPDSAIKGSNLASVYVKDNYTTAAISTFISSGITTQLTPAATLDIGGAHTVGLNASGTSITTLNSTLGPGEMVTLVALGSGTSAIGIGGNIYFPPGYPSPLVMPENATATLVRNDLSGGSGSWLLVSANGAGLPQIASYDNQPLAGNGLVTDVDQILQPALTANYNGGSAQTLFTPAAPGMWRISAFEATANSPTAATLPSVTIGWIDASGITRTFTLLSATSTSNALTVATAPSGFSLVIYSIASVPVTVTSSGYIAGSGTALEYNLAITAEQL